MQTETVQKWLNLLLAEAFGVSPSPRGFFLDSGQAGLLPSLDVLSAYVASTALAPNEPTISAHCGHLLYSLELFNAYEQGLRPMPDWPSSWATAQVNETEWHALRDNLKQAFEMVQNNIQNNDQWPEQRLAASLMLLTHTAYHVGQIKQLITLTNA